MAAIFTLPETPEPRGAGLRARGRHRPRLVLLDGGRAPRTPTVRKPWLGVLAVAGATVALVVVVLGIGVVFSVLDATSQPPTPAAVDVPVDAAGQVVVVGSGDTLTSIARELQPTGDITPLVERLAAAHGPAPLMAGERIALEPVLGADPGR